MVLREFHVREREIVREWMRRTEEKNGMERPSGGREVRHTIK